MEQLDVTAETSKVVQFVARHKKGFVIIGVIGLITPPAMMLSMVSCISSSSSFTLNGWFLNGRSPVSYTHLDVYKRQIWLHSWFIMVDMGIGATDVTR